MRIISGKYKGRRINPPKNLPVRPTTDMSKESLFNILNNHYHFQDLSVLDLFAGTGNISYEFASRGATHIVAVDQDFGCIRFIRQTTAEFDFDITAIKSNCFEFLEKSRESFDVIFADPPYDMDEAKFKRIVDLVFLNDLLNEGGMLIIEHSKHTKMDQVKNLTFQKHYGASVFSFFEKETKKEAE